MRRGLSSRIMLDMMPCHCGMICWYVALRLIYNVCRYSSCYALLPPARLPFNVSYTGTPSLSMGMYGVGGGYMGGGERFGSMGFVSGYTNTPGHSPGIMRADEREI